MARRTAVMRYRTPTARYEPPVPTRPLPTNSREWRAIRERILIRDRYTCQRCGCYGNEVDHKDGDAANNDDENLQTLCRPCHSEKTTKVDGGFGNRRHRTEPMPPAKSADRPEAPAPEPVPGNAGAARAGRPDEAGDLEQETRR